MSMRHLLGVSKTQTPGKTETWMSQDSDPQIIQCFQMIY